MHRSPVSSRVFRNRSIYIYVEAVAAGHKARSILTSTLPSWTLDPTHKGQWSNQLFACYRVCSKWLDVFKQSLVGLWRALIPRGKLHKKYGALRLVYMCVLGRSLFVPPMLFPEFTLWMFPPKILEFFIWERIVSLHYIYISYIL